MRELRGFGGVLVASWSSALATVFAAPGFVLAVVRGPWSTTSTLIIDAHDTCVPSELLPLASLAVVAVPSQSSSGISISSDARPPSRIRSASLRWIVDVSSRRS